MTAYYNEIDPYAAQWLRNLIAAGHIAPGDVDTRDIRDVRPSDLRGYTQCHFFAGVGVWSYSLRRAGWSDDRPVWTGSCPCQPFSAAGAGLGFSDERHLWPHWHWLIRECRPATVLGEQVASKDADPWIDLVQDDMEALDYAVGAVPFPAASVGAPHIRDRLYWVAHADNTGLEGRSRVRQRADQRAVGAGRVDGRVADAILQQRSDGQPAVRYVDGARGRIEGAAEVAGLRGDLRAGPTNGYWRAADWLLCRDGKWRPVEPGTFPLVDGTASRVGRGGTDWRTAAGIEGKGHRTGQLKGYGNAINAEAAVAWIECVMETF
ncbi:DNA cytosine methyltransferase [Cupriavidus gilardii]|uniref:DNA cytosine methyltransferase n=1 Tax=Cupriavidus gilardii TaxID=82541 RepID=UPI0021B33909|nr:DNA cytosine methyltransferase [Cupriavidus gilardii]UXC34821.1 DNA cytosine methyltransferase [Cupriavidus gilardii]UXC37147.1 DNA cytosine methyltransferase [Cupriavidus gilardii]